LFSLLVAAFDSIAGNPCKLRGGQALPPGGFTEGFDTLDLKEAKALLGQLAL